MTRLGHFAVGASLANPHLAEGAQHFAAGMGQERPASQMFSSSFIHPDVTARVAAAYRQLPMHDPAAEPAFEAMRHETHRQFDFLTGARRTGGLGIHVESTMHDPYATSEGHPDPASMMHDVTHNMRLRVLSTAATGEHPFFSNDENDMFRAVHDAFGHAATGRGFDRHGEEAAYRSHASMYSPLARRALATETRGQNSAFVSSGQFQPQKIALLPAGLERPTVPVIGRRSGGAGALLQARQFHSNQFGVPMP